MNMQKILVSNAQTITVAGVKDYEDLENLPSINNVELKGNKTLHELGIQQEGNYLTEVPSDYKTKSQNDELYQAKGDYALISDIPDVSNFITKDVNNLTNYELKADTGHSIAMNLDSSTYVLTLSLKNSAGTILNTQTVDLPLESVVVDGEYDSTNKKIVLELESGSTIDIPVGDLINGLQSEITSSNKLNADLVDDTNTTNKFVTSAEKTTWGNKYDKPSGGIPYSDLASGVQDSLDLADTALQTHQDISGKEDTTNKTTTIDAQSTNVQYPSAKAVYDLISSMGGGDYIVNAITDSEFHSSPFIFGERKLGTYIVSSLYQYSSSPKFTAKKNSSGSTIALNNFFPKLLIYYKNVNDIVSPNANTYFATIIGNSTNYQMTTTNGNYQIIRFYVGTNNNINYTIESLPVVAKYITGNAQQIDGVKTFTDIPQISSYTAPTNNTQFTPKKYVDDQITAQIGSINTILATLTTPGGNQ